MSRILPTTLSLLALVLGMASISIQAQEKPRVGESEGRAEQPKEKPTLAPKERASLGGAYRDCIVFQRGKGDPSDQTKLQDGDRILSINGVVVRSNEEMVREYSKHFVGDLITIGVGRTIKGDDNTETKVTFDIRTVAKGLSRLYVEAKEGFREDHKGKLYQTAFPDFFFPFEDAKALRELVDSDPEIAKVSKELEACFERVTKPAATYYSNASVLNALNHPFKVESYADYLGGLALKSKGALLSKLGLELTNTRPYLESPNPWGDDGIPRRSLVEEGINEKSKLSAMLHPLIKRMARCDSYLKKALAPLTKEEREAAMRFAKRFSPFSEVGADKPAFKKAWRALKKMEWEQFHHFLASAASLQEYVGPQSSFLKAITRFAAGKEGLGTVQSTTIGEGKEATTYRWVVGGKGKDNYSEALDLIIDLGGKDSYDLSARGNESIRRSQVIIDLGGNDRYSSRKGGIAAGVFGASILADHKGDDTYSSEDRGQGFGLLGVGALLDYQGNDRYSMKIYGQGLGCAGLGVLWDGAGNDRYDAGSFAQGCGFPGGYGVLADKAGDDVYLCTGKFPSPYRDRGEFQGFGQGCGIGFRPSALGGVGVIADGGGKDLYRCGQFGLGIGYWYGMGVVYEAGGDDSYECSRYGLGTGAHYGVGVVVDKKGNDLYRATRRSAVAEMGSVWDLSVGALIDCEGKDTYLAKSYALGGASQNAIGIFWDKAGDDLYSANGKDGALGYIGDASYGAGRGAKNLAIFLDSGGKDTYTMEGRGNGQRGKVKGCGIWADIADEPKKKEE